MAGVAGACSCRTHFGLSDADKRGFTAEVTWKAAGATRGTEPHRFAFLDELPGVGVGVGNKLNMAQGRPGPSSSIVTQQILVCRKERANAKL